MADSKRMKQFGSQLQQKNATVSIGCNRNHEKFSQNHETWETKFDNKFSQMCEETSNVICEMCEEIGRVMCEQM